MLQALVSLTEGREIQAIGQITQVLTRAEPERYIRLFIDEDRPMRLLLVQWLAQAGSNPLCSYASDLLTQFSTGAGKQQFL
jgi:hypothetical protein